MLALCLLALLPSLAGSLPLSTPVKTDADAASLASGNKFLRRQASRDNQAPGSREGDDEEPLFSRSACPSGASLRWVSEVAASVYATPLVADLFADGSTQVVVPTFVHYLEVLEARPRSLLVLARRPHAHRRATTAPKRPASRPRTPAPRTAARSCSTRTATAAATLALRSTTARLSSTRPLASCCRSACGCPV
jgi:hypothetical protein